MEIDVSIERIDNGYIVTDNSTDAGRSYYRSLEDFVNCRVIEDLKEKDKSIREHARPNEPFRFKLVTDL